VIADGFSAGSWGITSNSGTKNMTRNRVLMYGLAISWLMIAGSTALAQLPSTLQVPLFPEFDLFGNQFEVVQAYENGAGEKSITAGIYDTGASVVTFSAFDQLLIFPFQGQPPIPILPGGEGGATADAIGGAGTLTGDVSEPGRIYAVGASAMTIDFNSPTFFTYDLTNAVSVGGIQAFVGTLNGSPDLPTIVGTPINVPTATNPNGLATLLDQRGYTLNLGSIDPSFGNVAFEFPDVRFVQPGSALQESSETYETVHIPISLLGVDNTSNPGNQISAAPNPVQTNVAVAYTPDVPNAVTSTVSNQTFLFDTGAQLSIISTAIAAQLGLTDADGTPIVTPFDSIQVQGASGTTPLINGYILATLTLPRTDGGFVEFTDVPVYVLDIGSGLDGILGMNLFNGADSFLYDPYDQTNGPHVSVTFLNNRTEDSALGEGADILKLLTESDSLFTEAILATLGTRFAFAQPVFPGITFAPEPSTLTLGLIATVGLARRRRKARN
jgi:hypothetical protein